MYNAYVLHKWVFEKFFPDSKYKMDYADFVEAVARHFLVSKVTSDPYRTPVKRMRTLPTDETGPSGEVKVQDLSKSDVCPGGELEIRKELDKKGRVLGKRCKYCWNGREERVRKSTVYQCSVCKVPLCATCTVKYHEWLKFSKN